MVDGESRSKFYSSERFIDDQIHCMCHGPYCIDGEQPLTSLLFQGVSGDDRRICMVIPNPTSYESSSGGPFFRYAYQRTTVACILLTHRNIRDIDTNNGGDMNALYFYMVSFSIELVHLSSLPTQVPSLEFRPRAN